MNTRTMLFGALLSASVSALGVTVTKDIAYATAPTVVLEDFGGSSDPATTLTRVAFDSIGGGVANYSYAANETPEGTITYNPLGTSFDPAVYGSVRVRMAVDRDDGATSTTTQVFPTPISAATGHIDASIPVGTSLEERSFDLSTTSNPNGGGLRLDAFNYTNDGTSDSTSIDYIMADMGRTIGFEFDHDGDLNGITLNNASGSVSGGTLSGTAGGVDAQLLMTGAGAPTINADIYKYVEIRMKGTAGERVDFFWNTAARGSVTPKVDVDLAAGVDGDWHTYLLDFTDEADWTGDLTYLRLDPVADNVGSGFELDSIRYMETIPEPATLGLVAFLGAGMLWVRRRFMI